MFTTTQQPAADSALPIDSSEVVITAVVHQRRKVPLSRKKHIRGFHPVKPGHGSIVFESLLERDTISALARFPELVRITPQPLTISYHFAGSSGRYTPDLLVELSDIPFELECLGFGLQTLVECKPDDLVPEQRAQLDRHFRAVKQATGTPIVLVMRWDLEHGVLGAAS